MRYYFSLLFACIVISQANSQVSDSIQLNKFHSENLPDQYSLIDSLPQVNITENKNTGYASGLKSVSFSPIQLQVYSNNNLADLLIQETAIQIKSYGSSNLSTISLRGSDAGHTTLYWNDIPLNSPSLGISNINLIPVSAFDDISILYGGASSILGSGSIGGSIHLNNKTEWNKKGIFITANNGSWGCKGLHSKIQYATSKIFISTNISYNQTQNNFLYINRAKQNKPWEQLDHAFSKQKSLLQQAYFKISPKQTIGIEAWYQENQYEIPPTLTMNESQAAQHIKSFKSQASWKYNTSKSLTSVKTAYLYEYSMYADSLINLVSEIITHYYMAEATIKYYFSDYSYIYTGSTASQSNVATAYYSMEQNRNQLAGFASLNFKPQLLPLQCNLNLREEWVDDYFLPIIPSLGISYIISPRLNFKANVSKNYKLPTLNQLYWIPGGNEKLLPESGWSEETSVKAILLQKKTAQFFTDITVFNSIINNWILWAPAKNSTTWEASNSKQVWSRGVEWHGKFALEFKKTAFTINGNYSYTKATNQLDETKNNIGKQLIYVPVHSGIMAWGFIYGKINLGYNTDFTGKRYITTDNSDQLPYYLTHNAFISFKTTLNKSSLNVMFKAVNLSDLQYESVAWYPMPGRSFYLSVNYSFINS